MNNGEAAMVYFRGQLKGRTRTNGAKAKNQLECLSSPTGYCSA